MGREEASDFASLISGAAQVPSDPNTGANADLPKLFDMFPIPPGENVVDNEPLPDAKRIHGVTSYNLKARFQRFIMGSVTEGYGESLEVINHDDSVDYEKMQNDCLEGRAILCWEKINFLKDGAVVIAAKWMVKHDKPKKVDEL